MWDAAANLGGEAMVDLERVYYREFTITVKCSAEGWTCSMTGLPVPDARITAMESRLRRDWAALA